MRYLIGFLIVLMSCKSTKCLHTTKPNSDSLKIEKAIDRTLEKYFSGIQNG